MSVRRPSKGEKYRVVEAFAAYVLTMWTAPVTGGDEKMLPAGMQFTITHEPNDQASAVCADADPYAHWEKILVSAADRWNFQYGGYYLVIDFGLLERNCERII